MANPHVFIKGALFSWRLAVWFYLIAPICSLIILANSPESPVWCMTKGRLKEAKNSLTRLRGSQNMEIVDFEFNRIALNIQLAKNEVNYFNKKTENKLKRLISRLPTEASFWKPFGICVIFFSVGCAWTGFDIIAVYMVPLLQELRIPFDPFWASAFLASYRFEFFILFTEIQGVSLLICRCF